MSSSRTEKTIRNSFFALCEQAIYSVMSFICRTVFIYSLGKTYLGFNGLFSDILTLLSLAELGFGTAILYAMYQPMAEGNKKKIAALLNLYKYVYISVGIVVTVIGAAITPFLNLFISDMPQMTEIPIIYLLYLLNTTATYFFVYKKSILIIDQKSFVSSLIFSACSILQNISQIAILQIFKNYIVYLIVQVIFTLLNNILVSVYVDNNYSYLKTYKNERVSKEEKASIFQNVKAMFLSKISSAVVSSTDNLLISTFVSTITLGIYSNYTLFTTILRTVITKLFEGLTGSVGNLVATETTENIYKNFKNIWFMNYWLVAFCTGELFILINPFISCWLGEEYLLPGYVVLIICINFYMRFIRNTFITFTDTYGLFVEFKIKCIFEAVINLLVSLLLVVVLKLGIFGVLLGTFISNFATNFWYEPYILFNKKFCVPLSNYYKDFSLYFLVLSVVTSIVKIVSSLLSFQNKWITFGSKLIITVLLFNAIYWLIFHKRSEFEFLLRAAKKITTKFTRRVQ